MNSTSRHYYMGVPPDSSVSSVHELPRKRKKLQAISSQVQSRSVYGNEEIVDYNQVVPKERTYCVAIYWNWIIKLVASVLLQGQHDGIPLFRRTYYRIGCRDIKWIKDNPKQRRYKHQGCFFSSNTFFTFSHTWWPTSVAKSPFQFIEKSVHCNCKCLL